MPSAVIITAPRFQDEEFIYPYYRLQEADCHVDVATLAAIRSTGNTARLPGPP